MQTEKTPIEPIETRKEIRHHVYNERDKGRITICKEHYSEWRDRTEKVTSGSHLCNEAKK